MAPSSDDNVKLDASEANEVSAESVVGDSKTPEECKLEVASPQGLHALGKEIEVL